MEGSLKVVEMDDSVFTFQIAQFRLGEQSAVVKEGEDGRLLFVFANAGQEGVQTVTVDAEDHLQGLTTILEHYKSKRGT